MQETAKFQLRFLNQEQHLMLPTVTSIIITQNLYDILFQYVITEEKEVKLKEFIKMLESHIKSKSSGPFSLSLSDLEFLDDGLEELKLLNWMEVPVKVFELEIEGICQDNEIYEEELGKIFDLLEELITFNRKMNSNQIYVYPMKLTGY
ncbi:MAG: hypothetical protein ABFC94_04910 [Syntrophomonas sp.]